jgi:hypothetical protein
MLAGTAKLQLKPSIARIKTPRFGFGRMGYFVLTTVCTLTYLGYVPIPKQVLIGACVVYILYDAFKR